MTGVRLPLVWSMVVMQRQNNTWSSSLCIFIFGNFQFSYLKIYDFMKGSVGFGLLVKMSLTDWVLSIKVGGSESFFYRLHGLVFTWHDMVKWE